MNKQEVISVGDVIKVHWPVVGNSVIVCHIVFITLHYND